MVRYSLKTAKKKIRRLKQTALFLETENASLRSKVRRIKDKMGDLERTTQKQARSIDRLGQQQRKSASKASTQDQRYKSLIDRLEDTFKEDHARLDKQVRGRLADIEERFEERFYEDGPGRLARLVSRRLNGMDQDLANLDARFAQRGSQYAQDEEQTEKQLDAINMQLKDLDRRLIEHQDLHSTTAVGLMDVETLAEKVAAIESSLIVESSQVSSAAGSAAGPSTESRSSRAPSPEETALSMAVSLDKDARRRLVQALLRSC